ncbi:MAG: hypothetical protein L7F77_11445 [Candidatus Magnetominusculus sp. LBB02]|nr:hypothetical protein [Candidatus Magnetominusculus sp. LBB02]
MTKVMMRNMIRKPLLLTIILCLMQFVGTAWGADSPLQPLAEKTISFFQPLELKVEAVKGNLITLKGESSEKAVAGTRFDVFREGAVFYHPVTNEPLGHFENFIGSVEITGTKQGAATASLIKGAPKKGDVARLTRSKVKAMFYQDKSINWFLGDVYYRLLKQSGRFELIDTAIEAKDAGALFDEAVKLGADVLILIEGSLTEGINKEDIKGEDRFLKQRIFWVSDHKEVFKDTVPVTAAYLQDVLSAADIFLSALNEPILSYQMPTGYDLMAIGNLTGGSGVDLIFSTGSDLAVYKPGVDMNKTMELKGDKMSDNVYIDVMDINKDGKDEIIATAMANDGARAFVYGVEGGQLRQLWRADGFLRVYNNKLLFQRYSSIEGLSGTVEYLVWDGTSFKKDGQLTLPAGVNLYDFVNIETSSDDTGKNSETVMLFYDSANHLVAKNSAGTRIWRSKGNMGGFTKEYKVPGPTNITAPTAWHISDKMYLFHKKGVVIRRVPMALLSSSLGYKNSFIMSYGFNGISVEENALVGAVPGNIIDYSIYKDRIYVLSRPAFGLNFAGILKGDNPLITNLFVYKLL